jgi:hypothetical protein
MFTGLQGRCIATAKTRGRRIGFRISKRDVQEIGEFCHGGSQRCFLFSTLLFTEMHRLLVSAPALAWKT